MAVLGAIPGIGLAIVIAVIEFLWDGWRPHSAVLGRAEGVKGYHDITRYPDARQIPGLVLFRWDAPLFFANAELFKERVLDAVAASPTPVRWLVVAAEPVTSVDVTAADTLAELDEALHAAGIELCFAETEGSGQGQAEAIRAVRAARRRGLLSDHRRGRQQLSREPSGGLGGLGGPGSLSDDIGRRIAAAEDVVVASKQPPLRPGRPYQPRSAQLTPRKGSDKSRAVALRIAASCLPRYALALVAASCAFC